MVVACICLASSTVLALGYIVYLKGKCNYFHRIASNCANQLRLLKAEREFLNSISEDNKKDNDTEDHE